jgi:hypothetical protein
VSGERHLLCWVPQKELTSITAPGGRHLLCWVPQKVLLQSLHLEGDIYSVGSLRKCYFNHCIWRETPTLLGPLERANFNHCTWRETPTLLGPLERANLNHCTWRETPTLLGPLERVNLNHRTLSSPEDGNRSSFRNAVFSCIYNSGRSTQSTNRV